jgi:hypothetical protein
MAASGAVMLLQKNQQLDRNNRHSEHATEPGTYRSAETFSMERVNGINVK